MRCSSLFLVAAALLVPRVALSAGPCDGLSAAQKSQAQRLFKATYPYDCCDETLDKCLKQKKICKLVRRLRDDICRRVRKGQSDKKIKHALERRARSMTPGGKKASISLADLPVAGQDTAPVTVVVYACARCPFCSKVVPDLYRMVVSGPLKGKVRMFFKTFPIRSHKGSAPAGLAFMAALELDKFWPYVLKAYREFDSFSEARLITWAASVGLDTTAFAREMKDRGNRKQLVESKKEGLRNGVKATPTLFINGRQYYGDMDHTILLDVLGEAHDRARKRQYCGG